MADIKVPWHKRPVACVDCGYLCYADVNEDEVWEVKLSVRSGAERRGWEYMANLSCFKGIFDLYRAMEAAAQPSEGSDAKSVDYNAGCRAVLAEKRDCRFFYRYRPGYDASLHRDLEERERRDAAARVWNGVFVLLGSGLTLAATIIVLLLT